MVSRVGVVLDCLHCLLLYLCTHALAIFAQRLTYSLVSLYLCPQEIKEVEYKGQVHPVLEYGSSVWDPQGVLLQQELESVQKRAVRFVTGNNNYENKEYDWHSWTIKMGILQEKCMKTHV